MLPNSLSNIFALFILSLMFFLMFFSAVGDSATMDELAHIPAGYSYLAFKDYRLNPEHPPLIKDLSAIPLQFLNLKFPTDSPAWRDYINGQWDAGRIFLYESGNNADQIIFWARLPVMLLTIFFGWFFFKTIRGLYENKVGFLALFLFATSPTLIAHGRYVTTDVGAAFGFFFALMMFYKFLEKDNIKSLVIAGLSLGVVLLLKFSLFLLIPLFIIFGFFWIFLQHLEHIRAFDSPETKIMSLAKEEGKMIMN
ncbi:MAG: ArnT family glycosyltransferase [Candidatus Paceibacteria bacterium]